ncbi:hypothetical protein Q2941_26220 [Bradyrhizobium sp. UFLA05-153]
MNPFLIFPRPPALPVRPSRIYARLDDIAELAGGGSWEFLLGGLDADWFDQSPGIAKLRGNQRIGMIEVMPVFYLEFDAQLGDPLNLFARTGLFQSAWNDWVEIRLQEGLGARLYRNLYAEAEPVNIVDVRAVSAETADDLDEVHDLSDWEATDETIQSKLSRLTGSTIESLAVYDVGQGAANSGSPSSHKPAFYFDFGGGVRSHTSTRPHSTPDLCLCADPLIVLSHWDSDHWSSGPLVATSLTLDWIAPFQSVTSPHLTFAGSIITAGGTLLVSKAAAGTSFSAGQLHLYRASGTSRNDSGFTLNVDPPTTGSRFFFPGDADYTYVAGKPSMSAGLTATHHGGSWKSASAPPTATGRGRDRVVFSYGIFPSGLPNTYGHPTARSTGDHAMAGFNRLDTPLRTAPASTGHVHLDWAGTPAPTAPCGRHACYQNLNQA